MDFVKFALIIATIPLGIAAVLVGIGCERKWIVTLVWTLFLACGIATCWLNIAGA